MTEHFSNHPTILAFDTSTEACSVALLHLNQVFQRHLVLPRQHADRLIPCIDEVLAEARITLQQVDALAYGRGPGAFTGVRIGVSVAQGLALGANLSVMGISSLATLAMQAYQRQPSDVILVAIDARMDEVYWASFQVAGNELKVLTDECVVSPDEVVVGAAQLNPGSRFLAVGTGWKAYSERLQAAIGHKPAILMPEALPRAVEMLPLALKSLQETGGGSFESVLPMYLRNKVAQTIAERQGAKGK